MLSATRQLIRKNPLQFYLARRRHGERTEPDPSRTEHTEVLDALVRDGICVLPGYVPPDVVGEMRREVTDLLHRLRDEGEIPGARGFCYPQYACYHLDGIEEWAPSVRAFTDDPMILSVADAFGGGRIVPFTTRAELRDEPLKNELVDDLHADTWRFRFKAMLYLTDVTEKTSPFRYLAGSHRDDGWTVRRFGYDYLGHALAGHEGVERIRLGEAHRRFDDPAFRKMWVTGPAGTLILFDSRGLHSATTLEEGTRVILNRTFVLEEDLG